MCVALVGGCATSPYVEPNYPRPGLARQIDQGALVVVRDQDQQPITRHVSVSQAREYGRALQDAYRAAAASESQQRRLADFGVIGSAATALGIVATGGHAKTAGALGISAGGLSVLTDRYLDATRRKIYFQGALALECVIGMTVVNPTFNSEAIAVASTMRATHQFADHFRDAIRVVQTRLRDLGEEHDDLKPHIQRDIAKAETQLTKGEIIIRGAEELLDALDPVGQILLSKIEEIRIRVDTEVAKREPDLLDYNEALKKVLASTPSNFATAEVMQMVEGTEPKTQFSARGHLANRKLNFLVDALLDMERQSDELTESLTDLLRSLSTLGRESKPVSLNIFDRCALTDSIGIGQLRLSESAIEFPSGIEARVHLRVSGGSPPYSYDQSTLDSGARVEIASIAADGATLVVHVPKDNASGRIVLPVSDNTGNTRNLVITFKEPDKPETSEEAKQDNEITPQIDSQVEKIQKFLIRKKGKEAVGPNGPDGKLGTETRQAMSQYLKDNLDDLKKSNPSVTAESINSASDEELKRLMGVLMD